MKNEYLTQDATDQQIDNAIIDFCPFGYLDMKAAVNAAIQAGESTSYVYDCVSEFSESCETPINDCDPVYCVLDAILQETRNELDSLIGFDFCNDLKSGYIDTYGNFMCSCYNYSGNAKEELIQVLKDNSIELSELSDKAQYFFSELEITQEEIN